MRNAGRSRAEEREFDRIWTGLFQSPIHLDSAISKAPDDLKAALARALPAALRQPHSLAAALGLRLKRGEPWSLSPAAMADWEPARVLGRALLSDDGELPAPVAEDFPPFMLEEWREDWGEEVARRLVTSLGQMPPLTLRVSRAAKRERLLQELSKDTAEPGALTTRAPTGIRFPSYVPLRGSRGREAGEFEIQDEGSQVMAGFALAPESFASLLSVRPAESASRVGPGLPPLSSRTIIDACAGAGGKTLGVADLLGGKGRVYAYDVSERKLQALRRRASHAGLRNIQTRAVPEGDELQGLEKFLGQADVVLVDAPCTGWGVLKRNPDIKWRSSPDELRRLPELQARLLATYSRLVRPGGILVFGLCTFRKAESLAPVQRFSESRSDFELAEGGFFGPDAGSDGFFMQSWRKKG